MQAVRFVSFLEKFIDETQMPITAEHAFKEKSAKLLILLPLRTISKWTFQCEIPCRYKNKNVTNPDLDVISLNT